MPDGLRLALIALQGQRPDPLGALRGRLNDGTRTIGAAVIHEDESQPGAPFDELGEGIDLETPFFVVTGHDDRNP